jgi:hypothetical protein
MQQSSLIITKVVLKLQRVSRLHSSHGIAVLHLSYEWELLEAKLVPVF